MINNIVRIDHKVRLSKIGDQSDGCLKPCLELKAHSKLTNEEKTTGERALVVLSLQKKLKVMRTMEAYGLFELVVEVGSSLGLWIGLSALGLFDILLQAGAIIQKKMLTYRLGAPQ